MRTRIGLLAGMGISLLCLAWLLGRIDVAEVTRTIASVGWWKWLACVAVYLCAFIPRGLRWQLMLAPAGKVTFKESTLVVLLGFAANNLLPFRMGELVRAFVMGKRSGISKVTCLGSVAAERILDGLALLGLLALSLGFIAVSQESLPLVRWLMAVAIVIFVGASAVILLFLRFEDQTMRWLRRLASPGIQRMAQNGSVAFQFLRSRRMALPALGLSLAVWLIEGAMFALLLAMLGVEQALARGCFVLAVVNLSILVPSAPGYVGVFQAGAVLAFLALGMSETAGLAFGLLSHLAQFIPVTLIGVLLLPALGLKWGDLLRRNSGPGLAAAP